MRVKKVRLTRNEPLIGLFSLFLYKGQAGDFAVSKLRPSRAKSLPLDRPNFFLFSSRTSENDARGRKSEEGFGGLLLALKMHWSQTAGWQVRRGGEGNQDGVGDRTEESLTVCKAERACKRETLSALALVGRVGRNYGANEGDGEALLAPFLLGRPHSASVWAVTFNWKGATPV